MTTLDGRILGHHDEPARIEAGPEACLDRVDALFDSLLRTTQDLHGRLWGIGIGVPGPVEFDSGRPISPPIMPGWDGYPIRERFAARYGAPVWVDNDVNVLALGEWRSGVAAGHADVVVVKIGTGIGAGIISDGHLHRGAQGSAGDVGHIQVVDDPAVVCRCGNVGCLEALAGGEAIGRAGRAAAEDGRSPRLQTALDQRGSVTAEDVARAASFGDPVAVALLGEAGRRVGSMLASVVNFFNPSLIVIGGGVANSPDQLLAAIRETIYRRSLPLATRDLLVQRSSLGGLAGVIGASAMVVDQLFARDSIARWIEAGEPSGAPEVALLAQDGLARTRVAPLRVLPDADLDDPSAPGRAGSACGPGTGSSRVRPGTARARRPAPRSPRRSPGTGCSASCSAAYGHEELAAVAAQRRHRVRDRLGRLRRGGVDRPAHLLEGRQRRSVRQRGQVLVDVRRCRHRTPPCPQPPATTRSVKSPVAGSLRMSLWRPSGRISRLMTTRPSYSSGTVAIRAVEPPRQSSVDRLPGVGLRRPVRRVHDRVDDVAVVQRLLRCPALVHRPEHVREHVDVAELGHLVADGEQPAGRALRLLGDVAARRRPAR